MTILEKNIQALLSGVNEPLGNKLLNFIQNKTCSRFNIDENLNIYDKTHNVFMYENLEEELNFFYQSILEKYTWDKAAEQMLQCIQRYYG
ncbi:MAG: hypothetical protein K2G57_00130, partial [Campylobacter jejuni]|nr:hypothetical protein [Campylobacter jejuni]